MPSIAANTVASVSVQGDVNPCSFLGSAWDSGNLRQRRFEELWNEGQSFRRLRAGGDPGDQFKGGCRARAQFFQGSALAEDPWQRQHDQHDQHDQHGQQAGKAKLPVLASGVEGTCRS